MAYAKDKDPFRTGELRYPVIFCEEVQTTTAMGQTVRTFVSNGVTVGGGIGANALTTVNFANGATILHANIVPTTTIEFLYSQQTEINKLTHLIYTRYFDAPDTFTFMFRNRILPDQSTCQEKYQLHRWMEIENMRFYKFEAEFISQIKTGVYGP